MDFVMESHEADFSRNLINPSQFRSSIAAGNHDDIEPIALRCHNMQLQDQVHHLKEQLEEIWSLQQPRIFHLFPHLPPEIRLKIWRHALPAPRVLSIDFIQRSHQGMPHFESNHPPPILLQVCHESREVALENYELVFQAQGHADPSQRPPAAGTSTAVASSKALYFDFRRETLCFTRETMPLRIVLFLEDMSALEIARVRYLAIGTELPKDVMKYVTRFHALEVFSLIVSDPRAVAPRGKFELVKANNRSIWVMGAYWNHELTSWGRMEANIREAFEDERAIFGDCRVPRVEIVYAVSGEAVCCKDCPGHEEGGYNFTWK